MATQKPTSLAELCPNMPETKRAKLAESSALAWKTHGDVNEGDVFERKFYECCGFYYAYNTPEGLAILNLFTRMRPLIEAWVKEFTYNTDKVGGSFKGDLATGLRETTIRPLGTWSFSNAAWTQQLSGAPGMLNLIPDDDESDGSTETATEDQKTWLILGYAELIAGVPIVERVQEYMNDAEGLRNPLYVYLQQALSDLLIIERGSPLWTETGDALDIDVYVRNDTYTGFFPIGLECLVESQITDFSGSA